MWGRGASEMGPFFVSDSLWCIFLVCKLVSKRTSEPLLMDLIYGFNVCIDIHYMRKLVSMVKMAEDAL